MTDPQAQEIQPEHIQGRTPQGRRLKKFLSKNDALALLDIMDASISCREEDDLKDLLRYFGKLIGADYALCLFAALDQEDRIASFDILNANFPVDWLDRYVSGGYLHSDPVVVEHFRKYDLQFWDRTYRGHPLPSELPHHSAGFGLSRGYSCGARCRSGKNAGSLFYFSGESVEEQRRTEALLHYAVAFLHEALAKILMESTLKSKNILTLREREILGCMRDCKTDKEVASCLMISMHTVKFHLKNILYKLNATSRCEALSIAIQKKYI